MPNRISSGLKRKLSHVVGSPSLVDDPSRLAVYAYDSSPDQTRPDLVLFPQSTEQAGRAVELLHAEGIPYVARGAGTNLSGGSVARRGGVVISLSAMRTILNIDRANLTARVQPGVTNLRLQEALKEYGCFFAPDPASQRVSTIGGNVAENSGGPHCLKYGVTTNHILGVRLVAPDGEIVELGAERLHSPGPDLLGLFVGSEGTLGIATEIICRILPLPRATRTMLAVYDSTEDAGRTVSEIIAAGIIPATLEMMDNLVIRAVEEALHAGYPTDAGAVLIIEVDGMEEALGETIERIGHICRRNKVRDVRVARDESERDTLWAGRRGAFGAVARLFPNYSVSDGTVPRTELPQVLRRVSEIAKRYDLPIGNVFHAGDGNLHPLIFFDARNSEEIDRVHRAGKEILAACAHAGGTISGEHGIGSEKIQSMPLVFREDELDLMRCIKHALDPMDLCNPGKILPERTGPHDRRGEQPSLPKPVLSPAGETCGVPLFCPSDMDELVGTIGSLRSNQSFAAMGSNTLFSRLPHQRMPDAIVSTRGLRSVVEYDAENLTVTVEAGLSLDELQKELRRENLFLPIDAPPQATLGGIVSAALAGPRRFLHGAVRDLVLGLKFVDSHGRTLRAGGKTVKNVAGYDYGKLLIGSWGTFGIITEITFRLLPLPKHCAAFFAGFAAMEPACEAASLILAAGISPSLLTLVDQKAAPELADAVGEPVPSGQYLLVCGAEGIDPAVRKQIAEMKASCSATRLAFSETIVEESYDGLLATLTRGCYPSPDTDSLLSLFVSYPLTRARDAIETIRRVEEKHGITARFVADLSGGTLFAHFSPRASAVRDGTASRIVGMIKSRLRQSAIIVIAHGGNDASDSASSQPPAFITGGGAPAKWARSVSAAFDPANRLNPGLVLW